MHKDTIKALKQIGDGFELLVKNIGQTAAQAVVNHLHFGGGGNGVPSPAKKRGRPAFKQSGREVGNGQPQFKTKKKRKMSDAGRLAIAAAQKKRWAKIKGK